MGKNDAVCAFIAFEALCAQDAVPNNEPVILLDADIMDAVIDVVVIPPTTSRVFFGVVVPIPILVPL